MASATRFSSAEEERNGGEREMKGHPDHAQIMNKLVGAVIKKLAYSDPSKTLTMDQKSNIKRQVCRLLPVFKTPDHPTYAAMISEAVKELNEEHGSTEESISKFITQKFDSLPLAHASFLSLHLKKLIERGEIVCVSKNCYMLPGERADSLSKRKCVPRQKPAQKGREKRKSAKGDEHRPIVEEQVEVTEKQTQLGQQSEEPHCKAVDNQTGSLEIKYIEDQVNGRQRQRKVEEIAAIAEKQSHEDIEYDQHSKVVDDQEGSSDAQQGEVIKQQIQDIAVMVVPLKSNYKVPKEQQVEVTEQQQQHMQQSEELIQEEQHSGVTDCQNGSAVEENVLQHEASTSKSQKQEPVIRVVVKKVEKLNAEHQCMVTDNQNGSPDEGNVQQDQANSLKSQNQVQVAGVIAEEQNIEQTYKEDEVHVEVTEQLREDGHIIQNSIQAEQCSKMIDEKYGSTDGQQDRVNAHKNQKHMQEVAWNADKQNVYRVTEEQVEVIEEKMEYVKQSEESRQHMKVINCENGSSVQQNGRKDDVNGQQSENQMHISDQTAVAVEKFNFSEQTHNVNGAEQVEVTEQQREYEQQNAGLEEQNSKVIECQEQQKKQQDDVTEDQLQEIILSVEKQIDAKMQLKVADEHIEASTDKIIVEQCHTEEQSCEVIEKDTQAVKSDIHLNVEVVEAILTGPKAQQKDMISERNRPQGQYELSSVHDLLPMNQEKDAATVVNSNVPIANPKFSHDISSRFSEMTCKLLENNIKLQEKTHKLLENKIKVEKKTHRLLENNIKVQEKTLQVQEMLVELLKGFKDTNRNLFIEERLPPNTGDRENIDCGLPAKQAHRPEISVQTEALESQLKEMSASLKLPTDATQLFLKQGKLWNLSQLQAPKYQNKSVENLLHAVQHQPQEIGISERLWEFPTMEGDNEELSGPVRKKVRSSLEASHATEKQLQFHNAKVNPDFQEKQLIESDCEVAEAPKCQDKDHEAENVIKEKAVQSSSPSLELPTMEGDNEELSGPVRKKIRSSMDANHATEKQLQFHNAKVNPDFQEKQLIESDCEVAEAPKCQDKDHEAENVIKEKAVQSSPPSLELPTMEGDNEELSGPVRKKIRSSMDANHATEKQLQFHNAKVNPDFQEKQLSESDCDVAETPKCQDKDHEAENVIKKKAVQSSPPSLELTESEQSCPRQLEKQEQRLQRQLCVQCRKSEADSGVAVAPEIQEEQPKDPIHDKLKLDLKPADQHKFCQGGQLHSISELSLARKNQDTESEIEEKTRELKASAKETGQTQLQQRQLRPRSENLFKSNHSSLLNSEMPQVENPGVKDSLQLKMQSQVEKPGVGDSSKLKNRKDSHLNKQKRCTRESTKMPDAIGATLTCQIGSGLMIEPNPEALQDLRPTMSDHSLPMEDKQNPHGPPKKSNLTAGVSPDELTLASQHLVVDPQILIKPLKLSAAAEGQLAQTPIQFLQNQQLLRHMKLHSQSEPDILIVEDLSQTTKEVVQKQQLPYRRKLRSHSQAASQCEPDVQMIELPLSKHPCEKPQEQKHPKQPQKKRLCPPKPTLDRAGPAKLQKLQERLERRGKPPKSNVNTASEGGLISKNKQKQPKSPGKAKPQKVTKGKLQIQVRGKGT